MFYRIKLKLSFGAHYAVVSEEHTFSSLLPVSGIADSHSAKLIIHTRMIVSKYVKITALSDCIIQVFLPCFSDASANICILQSQKSNYHFRPRSM